MPEESLKLALADTAPPWDEQQDAFPSDIDALRAHRRTQQQAMSAAHYGALL